MVETVAVSALVAASVYLTDMYMGNPFHIANAACPAIPHKENMDTSRLMGGWYMMQQSNDIKWGKGYICSSMYYQNLDENTNFFEGLFNSMQPDYQAGDELSSMDAPIKCSKNYSGYCFLEANYMAPPAHWDVVDTDYDTYLIQQTCMGMMSASEYVFVYTREPLEVGSSAYNEMKERLAPILAEKLPWYGPERFMDMPQGGSCAYRAEMGN